jgi:hypothetical protein
MANVNSLVPCRAHAVLCHGLEMSLSEQHGHGMACLNQMGKIQSKPLAAQHGRGTGICELALSLLVSVDELPF